MSAPAATVRPVVRAGWDEFYRRHWDVMVRTARWLVDDVAAAEDVVQDAFIALHPRFDTLPGDEAAAAYLHRSVVNRSRSVLRHRAVVRRRLASGPPADEQEHPAFHRCEQNTDLARAVAQLTLRQRQVLTSRYWLGLTAAETARALGISAGTVKSTASRAIGVLRGQVADRVDHL